MVQPPSHWLYQLANAFLLVSYLSPNLLALRLLLAGGCICFALWGFFVLAISIDTVVWNSFFALVNLTQAAILLHHRRPIQLDPQLEVVYQHFFGKDGLLMSRRDFKALTYKKSFVKALEAGDTFAQRQHHLTASPIPSNQPPLTMSPPRVLSPAGQTSTQLSLLISGRMAVYQSAANEHIAS